ncbi:MAG: metallophosphoesterase [Candidatus Micrarchaeaceae archaeon]
MQRLLKDPNLKFLYEKPALLIRAGLQKHLVIGDLHIGAESNLMEKGIHVYEFAESMSKKIKKLMNTYHVQSIIILGDVKESILYPEEREAKAVRSFFDSLSDYEVHVVRGNHDAHLSEIIGLPLEDELLLGEFALLHGHMWPSKKAMMKKYIISAHNHIAVSMKDSKGANYFYKAWLVSREGHNIGKYYPRHKAGIKLISMPAFNDLIVGTSITRFSMKENLSPIFRNGVFDYESAEVYLLGGEFAGIVSYLSKKQVNWV